MSFFSEELQLPPVHDVFIPISQGSISQPYYENFATKIIILNQDGTLSEEFLLPDGINLETIQELLNNHDIVSAVTDTAPSSSSSSTKDLQPPVPEEDLSDIQSSLKSNEASGMVFECASREFKSFNQQTDQPILTEQNDNFLLLDEVKVVQKMEGSNYNNSMLIVQQPISIERSPVDLKLKKAKSNRSLLGLPRNPKMCPLCKFQARTKNPYRHLQDHLARVHFKKRLLRDLPARKPFMCPVEECQGQGKDYGDWQAVMRHYIGNKHGVLEKFVRETLD
eukprot:GFUD01021330.1.p1 GENE.GFUD01021330.1~~GFUD01021330.1.p1  ORF type:complete len:280 (-),score=65.96 GFUD01021330.1:105-944(-)